MQQPGLIAEEIFCHYNNDCIDTTYCCSDYSCVHPSKCLHGQKVTTDTCDYNFECYSRCCSGSKCAHFLNCHAKCSSNSECEDSRCCSEGYCTHKVVCDGNKVVNDSCDKDAECLTRYCDQKRNVCAEGKGGVDLTVSTIGVIGIALAVVVALVFLLT